VSTTTKRAAATTAVLALAASGLLAGVVKGPDASAAAPTTYYTAPNPSGTTDCSSPANACAVVTAVFMADDGDTVEFANGSYDMQSLNPLDPPLTVGTSIRLRAAAGARPVLDAHGIGTFGLITVIGVAHVLIDGLTLRGASAGVVTVGTFGASALIRYSTIVDNGFGIQALDGPVYVEDSTIADNADTGILARSPVRVTGSTVGHNGVGIDGPGPVTGTPVFIGASIVAGNTTDCPNPLWDEGYNIDGDNSCGFTGTGSVSGSATIAASLAQLADNGGPTPTMALRAGSPAIGLVTGAPLDPLSAVCGTGDQRGVMRPAASCDAGAFQTQTITAAAPTFTDDRCVGGSAAGATYRIPSTAGVEYLVGGHVARSGSHPASDGSTVTITARPQLGYVLIGGTTWSHTYSALPLCTKSQSITFTSTPPTNATVGDVYTVRAKGGGSGEPVVFSTGSASVCTVTGSRVHFVAAGSCVVHADQAGNTTYEAAPQVSQIFKVHAGPTPSTSATPSPAPPSTGVPPSAGPASGGTAATGAPTAPLIVVALLLLAGGVGLLLLVGRARRAL
jgi:hypothetical protein